MIFQAQSRLQILSDEYHRQRTSISGTIFTLDTSNPALGEAYKDPSGLIWGTVPEFQRDKIKMNQYNATKYCRERGARLPTKEEFEQLAKYLGKGSVWGYSMYLADGKTPLLSGPNGYGLWSSSLDPDNSGFAFTFNESYGYVDGGNTERQDSPYGMFRCVVRY